MRSTLYAVAFVCLSMSAGAMDREPGNRQLLEQMSAKASKLRFEASEMAAQLRSRDANLALAEVRMQLMDENAGQLRELLAAFDAAPGKTGSPEQLKRLRQSIDEISGIVETKQRLLLGPGADKRRAEIRSRAIQTAKLSQELRGLTDAMAD